MVSLGGGLKRGQLALFSAVSSGKTMLCAGEFSQATLMQAAMNTKRSSMFIDLVTGLNLISARQTGKTVTFDTYRSYKLALEIKAQLEIAEGIQSLRRIQLHNRKVWAAIGWRNGVLQPPPDYIDTGNGLHIPDY